MELGTELMFRARRLQRVWLVTCPNGEGVCAMNVDLDKALASAGKQAGFFVEKRSEAPASATEATP